MSKKKYLKDKQIEEIMECQERPIIISLIRDDVIKNKTNDVVISNLIRITVSYMILKLEGENKLDPLIRKQFDNLVDTAITNLMIQLGIVDRYFEKIQKDKEIKIDYTSEEQNARFYYVVDKYYDKFYSKVPQLVGFGRKLLVELMEKAILRGYAVSDKEFDEYTKANGYIISKDILY